MKARNFILILALILGIGSLGAARGLAYMQETYGGTCGQLDGFPGILQQVNLLATSNCPTNSNGSCSTSSTCTISNPTSGGPKTGKCTTVTTVQGKKTIITCVCK